MALVRALAASLTTILLASSLPVMAVAGSVTIKNCKNSSVWFKSFNSNDGFKLIAASEGCVKPGQAMTLNCATSSCYITANWTKCETWQPNGLGTFSGSKIWAGSCIYNGQVSGCMMSGTACP